jgi:hypothetical protein
VRMIVYTPVGEEDRALVARALAAPRVSRGCAAHGGG